MSNYLLSILFKITLFYRYFISQLFLFYDDSITTNNAVNKILGSETCYLYLSCYTIYFLYQENWNDRNDTYDITILLFYLKKLWKWNSIYVEYVSIIFISELNLPLYPLIHIWTLRKWKNVFQHPVWIQIKHNCIFALLHQTHVAFPPLKFSNNWAHVKAFRRDILGFMVSIFFYWI